MNFTVENLEFFVLILVRISMFIFSAPIFSMPNLPRKVKAGLSLFLAIILFQVLPYEPLAYQGVIGYAALVIKEAAAGLLLGFMANICTYILGFAGNITDMEIGFSMMSTLDPVTKTQTTITSTYYTHMVMLIILGTNLHYFIITAITDSFRFVPVGAVALRANSYVIMSRFIVDYFIIGFRIVLPVFAATLLLNAVLGILAKVAPQMNMFVIGMQLKIFVGIFILFLVAGLLPSITDFIMDEMKTMITLIMESISP